MLMIKTPQYLLGICNAVPILGKELESKFTKGEPIEVTEEQGKKLKSLRWAELYKGEEKWQSNEQPNNEE